MEVVGKDGRGRGHYGSIKDVLSTRCKYFLTRTTLNGFTVSEDDEKGLQVSEQIPSCRLLLRNSQFISDVCRKNFTKRPVGRQREGKNVISFCFLLK